MTGRDADFSSIVIKEKNELNLVTVDTGRPSSLDATYLTWELCDPSLERLML